MAITTTITPLPTAPDPATMTPAAFSAAAAAFVLAMRDNLQPEMNDMADEINDTAADVNNDAIVAAGAASSAAVSAGQAASSASLAVASANFKGPWTLLSGALNLPATVSHAGGLWLLLQNLADVTTSTPGTSADWLQLSSMALEVRTSNSMILGSDVGKVIRFTTTGFTQTWQAASALGAAFVITLWNDSTGDLTLDFNASETCDGLTTFVMYPGEIRDFYCDGTNFISWVRKSFRRKWTTSGTFTKPPGYASFECDVVSAGGGGGQYTGGGGGGRWKEMLDSAVFAASETITIGTGGVGQSAQGAVSGGDSSIGTVLVVRGAKANGTNSGQGGCLGDLSNSFTNQTFPSMGFIGAASSNGNGIGYSAEWGGGSGGFHTTSPTDAVEAGGSSLRGAGGGGGHYSTFFGNGGKSGSYVIGGGGAKNAAGVGSAGAAAANDEECGDGGGAGNTGGGAGGYPGGGGGARGASGNGGNGANGRIVISGVI